MYYNQDMDREKKSLQDVEKTGTVVREDFYQLIGALEDKDRDVRLRAVRDLGDLGNPAAVDELLLFIKREKWHFVRQEAWAALSRISPGTYKKERDAAGLPVKKIFFTGKSAIPFWTGLMVMIGPYFFGRIGLKLLETSLYRYLLFPVSLLLVAGGLGLVLYSNWKGTQKSLTPELEPEPGKQDQENPMVPVGTKALRTPESK